MKRGVNLATGNLVCPKSNGFGRSLEHGGGSNAKAAMRIPVPCPTNSGGRSAPSCKFLLNLAYAAKCKQKDFV